MQVKTKIINKEIETPVLKYSKQGDAGIDLTATSKWYDEQGNVCYGTNRAFEIPNGYVGLLFPRSSNANKDLLLSNSVGVIDSGYRGEVIMKYKPSQRYLTDEKGKYDYDGIHWEGDIYEIGERIGQLIILPYPQIEFKEVSELSETERGSGGYGSTGK